LVMVRIKKSNKLIIISIPNKVFFYADTQNKGEINYPKRRKFTIYSSNNAFEVVETIYFLSI